MRNEQRLILQLVIGMVVAMCQGSVFCFSLFGPTLKAPPFNYKESQVNIVAGIASIASFFSVPAGLIYDYFGCRPTYLGALITIGGAWIALHFVVFQPASDFLENNLDYYYGPGSNSGTTTTSTTTTTTTSSPNNHDESPSQLYDSHIVIVTVLFSIVMSGATMLEMAVMMTNLTAWNQHHGWLVVVLKSMIGIGSSAISLLQAAFFISHSQSENNNENIPETIENYVNKPKLAGQFCLFLGLYSSTVCILGGIFTSAPWDSTSNDNNDNKIEKRANDLKTIVEKTSSSSPVINKKKDPHATPSFLTRLWDIRVVGINTLPPSSSSSSSLSRLFYREKYKPAQTLGLWLLLGSIITVIVANSIELGVQSMPSWVFILIAIIVVCLPLLFLSLLTKLPGLEHKFPDERIKKTRGGDGDENPLLKDYYGSTSIIHTEDGGSPTNNNIDSSKNNTAKNNTNNNNISPTSSEPLSTVRHLEDNDNYSPTDREDQNQSNDDKNQRNQESIHLLLQYFYKNVEYLVSVSSDNDSQDFNNRTSKLLTPVARQLRQNALDPICSASNKNKSDSQQQQQQHLLSTSIQFLSEALSLTTEAKNGNESDKANALLFADRCLVRGLQVLKSCMERMQLKNLPEQRQDDVDDEEEFKNDLNMIKLCLQESEKAIKCDPNWFLGFLRRGMMREVLFLILIVLDDSSDLETGISILKQSIEDYTFALKLFSSTTEKSNNMKSLIQLGLDRVKLQQEKVQAQFKKIMGRNVNMLGRHDSNHQINSKNNNNVSSQALDGTFFVDCDHYNKIRSHNRKGHHYDYYDDVGNTSEFDGGDDSNNKNQNRNQNNNNKTKPKKPLRVRLIETIECSFNGNNHPLRKMMLEDLEDDYDEMIPQNGRTVFSNLYHHPVDFIAMWLMFFGLWGSTTMVYSNVYSIFYARQDDDFTFSSGRNAVLVSIFGVGNACGRALAGLSIPVLQGRGQPVWMLLRVAPVLNMASLLFFLAVTGAGLAFPFLLCGLATGFTWASTIVFVKKTFQLPGSHYAFFYTAGACGIVAFCIGTFSSLYEKEVDKQHQPASTSPPMNFTTTTSTTTTTLPNSTTFAPSPSPSASKERHCIGLECIETSMLIAALANFVSLLCAEFTIYRFNRSSIDTGLPRDVFDVESPHKSKMSELQQIVEADEVKQAARDYAYNYSDEDDEDDGEYEPSSITASKRAGAEHRVTAAETPQARENENNNNNNPRQQNKNGTGGGVGDAEGGYYSQYTQQHEV